MSEAFVAAFALVGVSEVGDRTQLATITLSTRYGKPFQVFLGAILAFLVADGLAVLVGDALVQVVPPLFLRAGSGILFLVFGILTLRGKDRDDVKVANKSRPLLASFNMVLLSEMGDKTQIATALLVAEFDSPLAILLGVLAAMAVLSIVAVLLGAKLRQLVPLRTLRIASGLAFIAFGVWSFIEISGLISQPKA